MQGLQLLHSCRGYEHRDRAKTAFTAGSVTHFAAVKPWRMLFDNSQNRALVYVAVLTHNFDWVIRAGEFNLRRFLLGHISATLTSLVAFNHQQNRIHRASEETCLLYIAGGNKQLFGNHFTFKANNKFT